MNRSRELAEALLQKARDDAWLLVHVLDEPEAPTWGLGFHAQQAVEKALKAVLAARAVEYPRTHNLGLILDLLRDAGIDLSPDADRLPQLTPFGALLRYEDDMEAGPSDSLLDRDWVRTCVEETLKWGERAIGQTSRDL